MSGIQVVRSRHVQEAGYESLLGLAAKLEADDYRKGLRAMAQQLQNLREQVTDPVKAWQERVWNCHSCGT